VGERLQWADFVEKHPFATAANSDLKSAQAPF